jgi:hypothetical protein
MLRPIAIDSLRGREGDFMEFRFDLVVYVQ